MPDVPLSVDRWRELDRQLKGRWYRPNPECWQGRKDPEGQFWYRVNRYLARMIGRPLRNPHGSQCRCSVCTVDFRDEPDSSYTAKFPNRQRPPHVSCLCSTCLDYLDIPTRTDPDQFYAFLLNRADPRENYTQPEAQKVREKLYRNHDQTCEGCSWCISKRRLTPVSDRYLFSIFYPDLPLEAGPMDVESQTAKLQQLCKKVLPSFPELSEPTVRIRPRSTFLRPDGAAAYAHAVYPDLVEFNDQYVLTASLDELEDTMKHELLHLWLDHHKLQFDGFAHGKAFEVAAKLLRIRFSAHSRENDRVRATISA